MFIPGYFKVQYTMMIYLEYVWNKYLIGFRVFGYKETSTMSH